MIVIVVGTRPEIIKMSPIIQECQERGLDFYIIHTGQHYSYNMDRVFFEQLKLPDAKYNLNVGSGSHGEQTGKMLAGIEKIFVKDRPDVVLVQGDTNTVLAGALAASKLGISIGHVEAGLRSYDRSMPEEINRVLTDHCSDHLFAPTALSKEILIREGIEDSKVFITGNTVVDALFRNLTISEESSDVLLKFGLRDKEYFLTTTHRQENVDSKERFSGIIQGLEAIAEEYGTPVVYPIHPRAMKMMNEFGISVKKVRLIEPVDYLQFIQLEKHALCILTDSGGLQEEACILKVPCVTFRDNTERPETVKVGANILSGNSVDEILKATKKMVTITPNWTNPFGSGDAGKRIIEHLATD